MAWDRTGRTDIIPWQEPQEHIAPRTLLPGSCVVPGATTVPGAGGLKHVIEPSSARHE
jgi:hypothetical protein